MKITAIHKEGNTITKYQLDNGKVVNKEKCISMVKNGKIEDCNIGRNKEGEEFVRTNRNDEGQKGEITNLRDLPTF